MYIKAIQVRVFDMPNTYRYNILSISIFCKMSDVYQSDASDSAAEWGLLPKSKSSQLNIDCRPNVVATLM